MIATSCLACMAGCSDGLASGYDDSGLTAEAGYITLTLSSPGSGVMTRATEKGDDAFNENTITVVDCYFYSNDNTSLAVIAAEGRSVLKVETTEADANPQYTVRVRLNSTDRQSLFGSGSTCRVYVVANSTEANPDATSTSLDNVRGRVLLHDFSARKVQASFVMSGEGQVTLAGDAATGTVDVYRRAAKLYAYVDVPEQIVEANDDGSGSAVWIPARDSISVSFMNGVRKASIDGTYEQTDDDYFNTGQYAVSTTDSVLYSSNYYHTPEAPFYTYPFAWKEMSEYEPVIIITVPWHQKYTGTSTVSYYQVHPNQVDRRLDSNHFYKVYCSINTVGSSDISVPVEIDGTCSVQEWGSVGTDSSQQMGDFSKVSYLVVEPTSVTIDNVSTTNISYASSSVLDVTKTYVRKVTYYTYNNNAGAAEEHVAYHKSDDPDGTEDNNITWDSDGNLTGYSVDLTTQGTIVFSHDIADLDYSTEYIEVVVTNTDGLSETVTITQRPPISILTKDGGNVFVDGYFGHVVDMEVDGTKYTVPATGNGWIDGGSYYYSAGYGGSLYAYRSGWTTTYSPRTSNNSVVPGPECVPNVRYSSYGYYSNYGYGTLQSDLSTTSGISQTAITDITVSSFNSSDVYDASATDPYYKIGDPRVLGGYVVEGSSSATTSNTLRPYLTGQNYVSRSSGYTMTTSAWGSGSEDTPDSIMVGSASRNARSIVAPHFYISSGWNSSMPISYENAKKRAATFQEAGYSAGRWRLPTEAEIMFITSLQEKGIITQLFGDSAPYWASSGRFYYHGTMYSAADYPSLLRDSQYAYTRFVYDAWYWGDEAGDPTTYHPAVLNGKRKTR